MQKFFLLIIFILNFSPSIFAVQNTEISPGDPIIDTLLENNDFVFYSPRPLIIDEMSQYIHKNIIGFDIMFSNSGFGFGLFFDRIINQNYKIISEIFFTPIKNSQEIASIWDWNRYEYLVNGKINRLYSIPLIIGVQRYIDIGTLTKNIRPYLMLGVNPTLIWKMPYESTWFDDVGSSKALYRMGYGFQIGTDIGTINTSFISVKIRYMYTPFGGDGLESVKGSPINNFGRFYLSLALGGFF